MTRPVGPFQKGARPFSGRADQDYRAWQWQPTLTGHDPNPPLALLQPVGGGAPTLVAANAASATTASAPTISQVHAPAVASGTSAVGGGTLAIAQTAPATQLAVAAGALVASGSGLAVTQLHALSAAAASTAVAGGAASLVQVHSLTASGGAVAVQAAGVALQQLHALAPDAASSVVATSMPALVQRHLLATAPAESSTVAGTLAIEQIAAGVALVPEGATSAVDSSSPAISQVHQLAAADAVSTTGGGPRPGAVEAEPSRPPAIAAGGGPGATINLSEYLELLRRSRAAVSQRADVAGPPASPPRAIARSREEEVLLLLG